MSLKQLRQMGWKSIGTSNDSPLFNHPDYPKGELRADSFFGIDYIFVFSVKTVNALTIEAPAIFIDDLDDVCESVLEAVELLEAAYNSRKAGKVDDES